MMLYFHCVLSLRNFNVTFVTFRGSYKPWSSEILANMPKTVCFMSCGEKKNHWDVSQKMLPFSCKITWNVEFWQARFRVSNITSNHGDCGILTVLDVARLDLQTGRSNMCMQKTREQSKEVYKSNFRQYTQKNKRRWEKSEKRRQEKKKTEKRKSQKNKDSGSGKFRKARVNVFFQWFVSPEGRKVGSLKRRPGARPSQEMRDEKLRIVVAGTFSMSNCAKHVIFGELLEVEMLKQCTLWWGEVRFQVKRCMLTIIGTVRSLRCWNLRKYMLYYALVTRSTFPSQHVENTTC